MKKSIKSIIKKMMSVVQYFSPTIATKILYRKYFGCSLNMKNPDTLNAKMQWLKLKVYQNSPVVRECVDKYAVRDYIKRKNREDALVPLIGVWNSVDEIDWDSLPSKFVMKCNHGSGSVLICKDKALFDVNNAKIKLKKWLAEDFGTQRAELSYKGVKKKILCEALIETDDGKSPKDYKFFCNYGEPKFLFVASDRHGEHAFFDYYDLNWNHYPVKNGHPNAPAGIPRPQNFNEMLQLAKDISKDFPLVRVDLYNEKGKVYFGELTFLHFGGLHPFDPPKYDKMFGDMIDIGNEND